MSDTPDYRGARKAMIKALREELVGPSPRGESVDTSASLSFETFQDAEGPFRQAATGDEILTGDRPTKRYGVGVLYPWQTALDTDPAGKVEDAATLDAIEEAAEEDPAGDDAATALAARNRVGAPEDDDDLPLNTANSYRPSSFGLSFLCDLSEVASLQVELTGARYREKEVAIKATSSTMSWWLRNEVKIVASFKAEDLRLKPGVRRLVTPASVDGDLPEDMQMSITALTRPRGDGKTLLTVSAVNRSKDQPADAIALFQAQLECHAESGAAFVLPYEESQRYGDDEELASLALLYRDVPAFAIGHGCSADWVAEEKASVAESVRTASLPEVEVPSTTPDILDSERNPIAVPMAPLAGLDDTDDGFVSLQEIVDGYRSWIRKREKEVASLPPEHEPVARKHLEWCRRASNRMQDGIEFLQSGEDPAATEAFKLVNHAMLLQQQHSGHAVRPTVYDRDVKSFATSGHFIPRTEGRGRWRPFQIAFALAALKSTVLDDDPERKTVELIFFPTGGGKTEAYLALTAFSIFYRRLRNPNDTGVDVLMRYTLRLLTAAAVTRAATLICAMDHLRSKQPERLGNRAISIGVWLGGGSTPNSRRDALRSLRELQRDGSRREPVRAVALSVVRCANGSDQGRGKGQTREQRTTGGGLSPVRRNCRSPVPGQLLRVSRRTSGLRHRRRCL